MEQSTMMWSLCVKYSGAFCLALHEFLDLLLTSLSFNWDKRKKTGEALLREDLRFIFLFIVLYGPWSIRGFIPSLIYSINIF